MMQQRAIIVVNWFVVILFMITCRYKEGPYISFRSVWGRVEQQKYIVEYTVNGADSMQYLKDKVFECDNFRIFFTDKCSSTEELRGIGAGDADKTDGDTCNTVHGFCVVFYKNYKYINIPLLAHPFYLGYEVKKGGYTGWLILHLTKDEMWLRAEDKLYPNKIYELKFKSNR